VEVHPVPKNVLTVEFKLFGSLTVKQFVRILIPCLLGVLLFVSPLPKLISIPLGIAGVVLGVMSALAEGFISKFWGFVKAIFVSPRYVWKKEDKVPEVLARSKVEDAKQKAKQKGGQTDPETAEVNLSLERLLEMRNVMRSAKEGKVVQDDSELFNTQSEVDNFTRTYMQAFGESFAAASPAARQNRPAPAAMSQTMAGAPSAGGEVINLGGEQVAQMNKVNNSSARQGFVATQQEMDDAVRHQGPPADLQAEVAGLQAELSQLNKGGGDPAQIQERKQEIMSRIDQLYTFVRPLPRVEAQANRQIYGVVVAKDGVPLAGAAVNLLDIHNQILAQTTTSADGKFSMDIANQPGEYVVDIQANSFKFPHFKLKLEQGKLPAYKFRAA
jgi:hypothetical protein